MYKFLLQEPLGPRGGSQVAVYGLAGVDLYRTLLCLLFLWRLLVSDQASGHGDEHGLRAWDLLQWVGMFFGVSL